MQPQEFDNLMREQAGWTFPAEHYETIVEPVYLATTESKQDFVRYCIDRDLNGLQLLMRYLPAVKDLAGQGMTLPQIHNVIYMLFARDAQIHMLEGTVKVQQDAIESIRCTLAGF